MNTPPASDKAVAALFVLLRAGLWEQAPASLDLFPLSAADWAAVYAEARRQTVTGPVYRGLCHLPDDLLPPQTLLMRWVVAVDTIERHNRHMNRALAGLYARLQAEGLSPLLLKGQGVAAFYAVPHLRECGDIDLCFASGSESRRAARLVNADGARVDRGADDSICYAWDGIEVEHHHRLLYIANPLLRRRLRPLETAAPATFSLPAVESRVGEGRPEAPAVAIPVPAPLPNLLMLSTHVMRHAFGWGIGLRQLCDMARACHSLRGTVDPGEVRDVSRRAGILRWNRLLHAFLCDRLGLPESSLPYVDERPLPSSDPLTAIVLSGGNFGHHVSDPGRHAGSALQRKWATSRSFLRNARFSCTYAPKEAFWTFTSLITGQIRW